MLVLRGGAAYLLTGNFILMQIFAISFAIFSSFAGIIMSFHYDVSTGALIVLTQTLIFIFSLIYYKFKAL